MTVTLSGAPIVICTLWVTENDLVSGPAAVPLYAVAPSTVTLMSLTVESATVKDIVNGSPAAWETAGVPEDFAVYLHGELESCAWTDAKGRTVDNPIRYMKSAWMAEQKKISAARVSADDAFGGIRVG